MNVEIEELLTDLESRLIAANAYAKTDRATADRFLAKAHGTFRDLQKLLLKNAAPASRELALLDCKRPDQPGQAQLSSPNT